MIALTAETHRNAARAEPQPNSLVTGSKRADSVRLWRTNLAALGSSTNGLDLDECSDYLVQRVDLGLTTNQSLLFDGTSGVYDNLSVAGVDGAFASATVATDVGSPGVAPSSVAVTITQVPQSHPATAGDSISFNQTQPPKTPQKSNQSKGLATLHQLLHHQLISALSYRIDDQLIRE